MLYEALALFSGALIAIMVTANGLLTAQVGPWWSVVIIHVCGLCTVLAILAARRQRFSLRAAGAPWYLYIPGVIGVGTTMLNNLCFAPLGAGLMLALCLTGQLLSSTLIDHFGWFGLRVHRFTRTKLVCFALIAVGLICMIYDSPGGSGDPAMALYVLLALATGIALAFSTTLNAVLGKEIGIMPGALVNYITGLSTAALCLVAAGGGAGLPSLGLSPFLYTGGILGVCIIAITSFCLPKVPVVYITIILFTGQVLTGLGIDAWSGTALTWGRVLGCAIIAIGFVYNVWSGRKSTQGGATT